MWSLTRMPAGRPAGMRAIVAARSRTSASMAQPHLYVNGIAVKGESRHGARARGGLPGEPTGGGPSLLLQAQREGGPGLEGRGWVRVGLQVERPALRQDELQGRVVPALGVVAGGHRLQHLAAAVDQLKVGAVEVIAGG